MISQPAGNIAFYGGTGASQVFTSVTQATLAGLISGWSPSNLNTYSFHATRATATTGTYDVFINGIKVVSNIAYAFGTGGSNGEVNFEIINTTSGSAAFYDDFSITTIPEPSAALLGGLGMLALLRRRRA